MRIHCFGEIRRGPFGLDIVHPEYRRVRDEDSDVPPEETLTPIYPLTEGVPQGRLRALITEALPAQRLDTSAVRQTGFHRM